MRLPGRTAAIPAPVHHPLHSRLHSPRVMREALLAVKVFLRVPAVRPATVRNKVAEPQGGLVLKDKAVKGKAVKAGRKVRAVELRRAGFRVPAVLAAIPGKAIRTAVPKRVVQAAPRADLAAGLAGVR